VFIASIKTISMKIIQLKRLNIESPNWKKLTLELFVVFLGVTMGFLLNNWQGEQQSKDLEQKYMNAFHQDVVNNIEELKAATTRDSVWLKRAIPLFESMQTASLSHDSAQVVLQLIVKMFKIGLNTGTYQDMTNSGNLNLLADFALKAKIVDYHMELDGGTFFDDHFYQYYNDFVMPFVFEKVNLVQGDFVDAAGRQSVQFTNVFYGYVAMMQQRQAIYKDLLTQSYELEGVLKNAMDRES